MLPLTRGFFAVCLMFPCLAQAEVPAGWFPRVATDMPGGGRRMHAVGETGMEFLLTPDNQTVWYEVGIPQG